VAEPLWHGEQGSLASNCQSPPGQPSYSITYGGAEVPGAVVALRLRPHPSDPWSPPLLIGCQRLMNRQAAERLSQHERILYRQPNGLRHR
jgi:hypothetical protein